LSVDCREFYTQLQTFYINAFVCTAFGDDNCFWFDEPFLSSSVVGADFCLVIGERPDAAAYNNFFWPGSFKYAFFLAEAVKSGRFVAATVAFVINYACYFSEIYRGGIESIPVGQYEAGQVLGMTKTQIFFHVTLLQVIKRIVPPIGNEVITW